MNKSEAEEVIKETIEYANNEIIKNKKKSRKRMIIILSLVAVFLIIGALTGEKQTKLVTVINVDTIEGTSKDFDESMFSNMNLTFTTSGAPVVDDACASVENYSQENGYICAKTICDTWGYKDNGLSTEWFVIPKGKVISVVSNDLSNGSVEVKYAGVNVYVTGSYVTLY